MASASTWPQSRQVVLDLNGDVVPGALLRFYRAGTTTPLTVYSDPELDDELPFPAVADGNGRWPRVYLPYVDYREYVTTPDGMLLWDDDGIANPAPPMTDTTVPVAQRVQTGTVIHALAVLDGFVRLNGNSIGNGSSGATERANDDTRELYVLTWNNVPDAAAPVSGGRGANAETDFAAGKTLTLPNFQGTTLAGVIGMGGTASTILDAVTFTAGAKDKPGSRAGAATQAITAAQLAAHTHGGATGNVSGGNPNLTHDHAFGSQTTINYQVGATALTLFVPGGASNTGTNNVSLNHAHSISSAGSDEAHPNMQPTGLVYLLVKL